MLFRNFLPDWVQHHTYTILNDLMDSPDYSVCMRFTALQEIDENTLVPCTMSLAVEQAEGVSEALQISAHRVAIPPLLATLSLPLPMDMSFMARKIYMAHNLLMHMGLDPADYNLEDFM